jgi:hypothetical protein
MVGFGGGVRGRRSARRLGALLGLLAVVTVALPIGSASAAVVPAVGLNGTVLGFSGWYGSYTVAGVGTGFCLDFGKLAPDSVYNYRLAPTVTGALGGQLAYVARTYGGTRDAVTAAATKLVIHDLQNARYPYGELNVNTLQPSQVAGFGGRGGDVIAKARAVMAETLARYVLAPYRLTLSTPSAVSDTLAVPVSVTLLDGRGKPVVGARVTLTATNTRVATITVTTDTQGKARTTFTATSGDVSVRITASVVLPSPTPLVYAPTNPTYATRAQRIIVAGNTPLTQTRVTTVRTVTKRPDTTVTITVRKTGDATAYHPIDGATFELRADAPDGARVAGPVTVADGRATFGPVVTNDLDDLWLVETTAPAGYALADPVSVPLEGTATVDVADAALRGSLRLVKVDAQTQQPVAGAILRVRYDADADGTYETDLGTYRTETTPVVVADLLPGRYEVVEVTPPPGYELPAAARSVVVLTPDGTLTVTFSDSSLTTVRFVKQPTGVYPTGVSLAGATFVVMKDAGGLADPPIIITAARPHAQARAQTVTGEEVGRCTTDAHGGCALPDNSLVTGTSYCWTETVAPPGFALADGGCFTAAALPQVTVVTVAEQGRYTVIEVGKTDADDPTRPLAGAQYALLADGSDTTLATATTGADGVGRFPPMLPGLRYCVREISAPDGYQLDPATHCTDGPITEAATIRLSLTDRTVPAPSATPTPTPTTPTPSAPPSATPTPEVSVTTPPPPTTVATPPVELPRTGTSALRIAQLGLAAVLGGAGLLLVGAPARPRVAVWPAGHSD